MRLTKAFGIIFILAAFLAGTAPSQATSGFKTIEIRLVTQELEGGTALVVEGSDRTVEVESKTLLGPPDFVSIGDVEWTEGKPGFNVALTSAGAEKYEQISTQYVGRKLAIIVDGKILMTPEILDPVRAQGFLLTLNSETEAEELAAKVRQVVAPNQD